MTPVVMVQLDDQPGPLRRPSWRGSSACRAAAPAAAWSSRRPTPTRLPATSGAARPGQAPRGGRVHHPPASARRGDGSNPPRHPHECTHERTWVVPVPAGHRWAERDDSRRAHLVPDATVSEWEHGRFFIGSVASLCQAELDRGHSWHALERDYPECRRCQARARELAGAAS